MAFHRNNVVPTSCVYMYYEHVSLKQTPCLDGSHRIGLAHHLTRTQTMWC